MELPKALIIKPIFVSDLTLKKERKKERNHISADLFNSFSSFENLFFPFSSPFWRVTRTYSITFSFICNSNSSTSFLNIQNEQSSRSEKQTPPKFKQSLCVKLNILQRKGEGNLLTISDHKKRKRKLPNRSKSRFLK